MVLAKPQVMLFVLMAVYLVMGPVTLLVRRVKGPKAPAPEAQHGEAETTPASTGDPPEPPPKP